MADTLPTDIDECVICTEIYWDLRSTPCMHSSCYKCIAKIPTVANRKSGDGSACPVCSGQPENGVEDPTKRDVLKSTTEALANHCEVCPGDANSGGKKRRAATMWCVECDQRLCETCVDGHRRIRVTRDHQLVKMGLHVGSGKQVPGEDKPAEIRPRCEKHLSEDALFFCTDCKSAICAKCLAELHKRHEWKGVEPAVNELRKRGKEDATKLIETANGLQITVEERKNNRTEFTGMVDNVLLEISECVEWKKEQIERDGLKLSKVVELIHKEQLKRMDQEIEDMERCVSQAKRIAKMAEELACKSTSDYDVTQHACELHDQTVELLKLDGRTIGDHGNTDAIVFTRAIWSPMISGNLVGQVERTSAGLRKPSLIHIIGLSVVDSQREAIVSVTSLKDEVYVIHLERYQYRPTQIAVYSASTFQFVRTLPVDDLGDSCKLASCSKYNCIYVSSFGKDTVRRVDVTGNGKSLEWKVRSSPSGLYVNRHCHVIVTCACDNMVQVFTPDGKLIREVRPQSTKISDLQHAAQMSNGHFVISHSQPEEGISVIDEEGQVVSTYRNDPPANTHRLKEPRELLVDRNDNIIVADWGNKRLYKLNSSLTEARDLDESLNVNGAMEDPYCLHLDVSRGRLYVGEYRAKRVLVFHNVDNAIDKC